MTIDQFTEYQASCIDSELIFSESEVEYRISDQAIEKFERVKAKLFYGSLAFYSLAAILYFADRYEELVPTIAGGSTLLLTVLIFNLVKAITPISTKLDLNKRCFRIGNRQWQTSNIKKVVVKRNVRNQRYSDPADETPDGKLQNITVHIYLKGRMFHIIFGTFKSTDIAYQYSKEIMQAVGFEGDIKIDGKYEPSIDYW